MKKTSVIVAFTFILLPFFASAQTTPDTQTSGSGAAADGSAGVEGIKQTINPDGTFTQTQAGVTPSGAAYQFQRQGIFDCNQNGSYAMSVGALSAIGGAYVPVADAAVELNTGTLVYKECILREVVDRERESALSAFYKQADQAFQTGRNGNPLYPVNLVQDQVDVTDRTFYYGFLQDGTLSNLNPALQGPITRAVVQNYQANTRLPIAQTLNCPYQGDLTQWWNGSIPFTLDTFWQASQPQCDAVNAYFIAQDISNIRMAQALKNWQTELDWGRGVYPITDNANNPLAERIRTPSSVVETSYEKLLQSPIDQLQSANDIGQMIGALYAGITTQVISDSGGLAGISQSVGGQPSYLDQVVSESAAGVRNAAANVALNILGTAQQVERSYFQAVSTVANSLTQAISQLRTAENQCWNLIIPKVCTSSLSSANTCQSTSGQTLKVATSTVFSQAVIDSQILPLATTTAANLKKSQTALGLIAKLIAGVTNTTSLNAQRVSLQQLDSLVAQRALHTQNDLQGVAAQVSSVQDSMTTLVQNTVQDWADGTPNGAAFSATNSTGWCNVNSQATLDVWANKWKQ